MFSIPLTSIWSVLFPILRLLILRTLKPSPVKQKNSIKLVSATPSYIVRSLVFTVLVSRRSSSSSPSFISLPPTPSQTNKDRIGSRRHLSSVSGSGEKENRHPTHPSPSVYRPTRRKYSNVGLSMLITAWWQM